MSVAAAPPAVTFEPRCLWPLETHAGDLASLGGAWSGGWPAAAQRCAAVEGLELAAVRVTMLAKAGYAQRVEQELRTYQLMSAKASGSIGAKLRSLEHWGACVPRACLLGGGRLIRAVLQYVLLVLVLGLQPPLPSVPDESELDVVVLAPNQTSADASEDSGICFCDESVASPESRATVGDRLLTGTEALDFMQRFLRGGHTRAAALRRVHIPSSHMQWLPGRLHSLTPSSPVWGCGGSEVAVGTARASIPLCAPGLLNRAVVIAVAALVAKVRPATFIARLDDALRLALLMKPCPPASLLSAVAGRGGFAPLPGLTLPGVLAKSDAAHKGFLRGLKVLPHPLQWGGETGPTARSSPSKGFQCDAGAVDAAYSQRARAASGAGNLRVACLIGAVWPDDRAQMVRMEQTFARHCGVSKFFVAASRTQEARLNWKLRYSSVASVVNLAQVYPDAREDVGSFMRTDWESADPDHSKTHRTRKWFGNTIEKYLLIVLYAANHLLRLSDMFCLLELDSFVVIENLQAFVNVHGLHATDPVYLSSLYMDRKLNVMAHPSTATCITAEGVRRMGQLLQTLPRPALRLASLPTQPDDYNLVFTRSMFPTLDDKTLHRFNDCAFAEGHWYDLMLGRCLLAANVSIHESFADSLGRYYFSIYPLPCAEHLPPDILDTLRRRFPLPQRRLEQFASFLCEAWGFRQELHRYAACEPIEFAANAQYWISPFAIGFHGYKNMTLQRHAYKILYGGAACSSWAASYRPRVARL